MVKKVIDISEELPFKDNQFDVIIADLSLHYFTEFITKNIMKEIRRILKCNGYLLARVNSVDDINYGANKGLEIEHNYFFTQGYNKRFFDEIDVKKYFGIIGEVIYLKENMYRYSAPKNYMK